MRVAYIDEAGISNIAQEPFLVIAAVILNGDQDWIQVDRHIKSIVRRHLDGRALPYEFTFHAKDIWHGSGHFDRRTWTRDKRSQVLLDLSAIPRRFHLPVAIGCTDRNDIAIKMKARMPNIKNSSVETWAYVEAYAQVISEIDNWMKCNAPNEVVMIIAEDTPRVKQAVKLLHSGMVNDDDTCDARDVLNPKHVIDTVHFARKADSAILQIADTCAFVTKRIISGKSDTRQPFEQIEPQLVSRPRDGTWRLQAWPMPRGLRLRVPREWTTED